MSTNAILVYCVVCRVGVWVVIWYFERVATRVLYFVMTFHDMS